MNARIGLIVLMVWGLAAPARAKLVACVGDSITYGSGISDRQNDSYPAQLQRILRSYDPAWEVRNFGVSGATLLQKGDRPYIRESAYASALMTGLTDGSRMTVPLISQTPVTDDSWHRIRLVWDGSRRYLYVDGGEVAADKRALKSLRSSTAGFHIGAGKALESGSFWPGLVDDVRIYGRAVRPR